MGTAISLASRARSTAMRIDLGLLRPLPLVALAAWLAAPRGPLTRLPPSQRSTALTRELAAMHIDAAAQDVRWIDLPDGAIGSRRHRPRALVRAHQQGEPSDVFLVRARLSPEGSLLGVEGVYDLTRTSAVGEDHLETRGEHAAWTMGDGVRAYRVELADLGGEKTPEEEWPLLARAERALMNLQQTGQRKGLARRSFKLDPAAKRISVSLERDRVVVVADEHRMAIPWDRARQIEGQRFLREDDRAIARPGSLLTWAVDRARDLSWFGDERMQLTKAIAFRMLDRIDRALGIVRA